MAGSSASGQFRFEAGGQGYVMISNEGTKGHRHRRCRGVRASGGLLADLETNEAKNSKGAEDPPCSPPLQKRVKKLTMLNSRNSRKKRPQRPRPMAVAEHEDLGDSPIHIRGSIAQPRRSRPARVHPAQPITATAPAIPKDQSGRLQLAQWITSQQNTLTARVLANRVWMHLFGEGHRAQRG